MVEEGVFQIYTTLSEGEMIFKSAASGEAFSYYIDDTSKLREGRLQWLLLHRIRW